MTPAKLNFNLKALENSINICTIRVNRLSSILNNPINPYITRYTERILNQQVRINEYQTLLKQYQQAVTPAIKRWYDFQPKSKTYVRKTPQYLIELEAYRTKFKLR